MFTALLIVGLVLAYLFAGVIFLSAYVRAMKPEAAETEFGLIVLFWVFVVVTDASISLARAIGKVAKKRFERSATT